MIEQSGPQARDGSRVNEFPDSKRERIKAEYTEMKGYWPDGHDPALELDPDWLEAFMNYGRAVTEGSGLDPKVRELVYIAVDGCVTHLYGPGTKSHIRRALELGATKEEILGVLKIVTLVGAHSTAAGFPLVQEVLRELGQH
jgi:alkylhydroperoxidase/carboxymuconolactone decarboxylase family protein YurZ